MLVSSASGDDAGKRPIRSKTPPDQGHPVGFHQRLARKSQHWLVACLALVVFLSLIGVEPNWLIMWQPFRPCPPFQPGPLGGGSPPSRSAPGGSIPGNTFRSPRHFCNVPNRYFVCMNKPLPCSSKVHGWSVLMRKPRFKLVKQNKFPVQPSKTIRCINPHATFGMGHSTSWLP